jgi:hypothetical protein
MFLSRDISTQIGTMALAPQVVDAVKVPVIAAGDMADARHHSGVRPGRLSSADGNTFSVLSGSEGWRPPPARADGRKG